jgi:Cys-rich repeat protein
MRKFGWLLGLAALAGCDDDEAPGTAVDAAVRDGFVGRDQGIRDLGVEPDRGVDDECSVNADCEDGETCDDGTCVPAAPDCVGDEDCAVGEVCEAGACVPEATPDCVNDDDCDAGEVCTDGTCVPDVAPECVDDNDCGAGEVCEAGACVPDVAPECVDDGDCGLGQTCQGGVCEDVECVNDGDCGAGETCEAGACVDAPGCRDDADCALGEACEAGACVDVAPECRANADCGPDQVCVAGVCEDAPPPPQCQGHADCLPNQLCIDGVCEDNIDPDCLADADCAPGQVCLDGICQGGEPVDCANAIQLNGFGQVQGSTVGLQNTASGICGGDEAPEAVYVFVPQAAGEICVNTLGSDYDTVVHVRAGDCLDANAEISCNDDDPADLNDGLHSAVTVDVADVGPLYIFVDGFDGAGNYTLSVSAGPCGEPPVECAADADCALGEVCVAGACVPEGPACVEDLDCELGQICVDGTCERAPVACAADADCAAGETCVDGLCTLAENGTCEAPFVVDAFGDRVGTTEGDDVYSASCGASATGAEDVYAFAVNAPGTLCLRTAGSDFDTVLHVRAGDCLDDAQEVACNDDVAIGTPSSELELVVDADVAYYVFVDGYAGAAGDYTLSVSPGPCDAPPAECLADEDCAVGEICVAGTCEPAPVACAADADCAAGETCVDGLCTVAENGTCEAPFVVAAFGDTPGTTAGADVHTASCGFGATGPEDVYAFAVNVAGTLCLSTAGSAFDTVLHVRSGDCLDDAQEVACNDDVAVGNTSSELELVVEPDVAYYVFVDGYNRAAGNYTLSITDGPCGAGPAACVADADCAAGEVCVDGACQPAAECVADADCAAGEACVDGACQPAAECVADADCAAGEVCVGGACEPAPAACVADADCAAGEACVEGTCAVPGTCEAPFLIDAFGAFESSVVGAPAASRGLCGGNGPENVFVFAVDAPGAICLSTVGSTFDTVLHVRADACGDAAAEIGCNDDTDAGSRAELTVQAEAGVDYFVFVDSFGAAGGDYVLTVSPGACGAVAPVACEVDADCAVGEICDAGVCVAEPVAGNGTCEAPNPIVAVGAIDGTTAGAGVHGGSCGGGPASAEAVYVFSVDADTPVCLDTNGSLYDTVLYVRTACGDAASEVGCDDDDGVGTQSLLEIQAVANVDYFVFVDGFTGFAGTNQGDYTLNVAIGACP